VQTIPVRLTQQPAPQARIRTPLHDRPGGIEVTQQELVDRLKRAGNIEILRTYAEREAVAPPIAVVRMSEENVAALRRSGAGAFVVEPDRYLRAASSAAPLRFQTMPAMTALGPDSTVTIQVSGKGGEPIEQAEVRLLGSQASAQGQTGKDGRIDLALHGELPETVAELFVNARSGYWGLWRHRPDLQADTVNPLTLEPLSPNRPVGLGRIGNAVRSAPD